MKSRSIRESVRLCLIVLILPAAMLAGVQGRGMRGRGAMQGDHREDMATIHALFADREKIDRKVTKFVDGIETVTESSDPDVAARIVQHTYAMKERLEKKQPIRAWDPLFAELFKNASKIRMEISRTPRGVNVKETSEDPYVVKLIQAHADAVSEFIKEGMPAMHKRHEVPSRD